VAVLRGGFMLCGVLSIPGSGGELRWSSIS
jgi:hypothetical protein